MTENKIPLLISQAELAQTISVLMFPVSQPTHGIHPGNSDVPDSAHFSIPSVTHLSAEQIAESIFTIARDHRAEADRWLTGSLYVSDFDGTPQVYLREKHGWWAYGCNEHFRDGSLNTTGWRRLVPDGEPAGPGPLHAQVPVPPPVPDWYQSPVLKDDHWVRPDVHPVWAQQGPGEPPEPLVHKEKGFRYRPPQRRRAALAGDQLSPLWDLLNPPEGSEYR